MKKFSAVIAAVLLLLCSAAAQAAPIEGLRTSVSPARLRIVLDSSEPISFREVRNGRRLEVELPESAARKLQPKLNDTVVKSVRLLPVGRGASRLLVECRKDFQYRVYQLQAPHRLVIDIFRINIVKETSRLEKGISYTYAQDEMNGRQIQAYIVEAEPGADYELLPFSAAGSYNGRGKISQQAAAEGLLAAVNASYFDTDGWVIGSVKNQGRMMAADGQPRSGLVQKDGRLRIIRDIAYSGRLRLPDGRTAVVKGMNRVRLADDLVLYNSFYAPSTKTNAFGREVKLVNNRVTAVSTAGNMPIAAGSIILSGHGAGAAALAGLKVGDRVELTESLGSRAADEAATVVSGGPLLVENGSVNVRVREEAIAADIARGRAPRTAVGLKKDGTLLLVVVDGRSNNSAGLTLQELAVYMLRLGAREAVNYDGGGSSVMAVRGRVVNKPSDGRERLVSLGLGLRAG